MPDTPRIPPKDRFACLPAAPGAPTPSLTSRQGIIAGGNWVVDHIKVIDVWPQQDALAHVLEHTTGNGGAPYNVLKDLARLQVPYPLEAIGRVGDDADGRAILLDCRDHQIDTTQLCATREAPTATTDVMTERDSGRRTFFYKKGANAWLDESHFDFSQTRARHFHYGYLLLLDQLDRWEGDRPALVSVLERARAAGLTTSMDCVSEATTRLATWVPPVLPSIDVFFANDFETERILGTALESGGGIHRLATERAAARLAELGVKGWIVLHFPSACYGYDVRSGQGLWQPSVKVSPNQIVSCAGAGDALAAGVLHGWHEGWDLSRSLALGAATAARSLLERTCSDGVLPLAETLAFAASQGHVNLPP